jgi:hypothetical protein
MKILAAVIIFAAAIAPARAADVVVHLDVSTQLVGPDGKVQQDCDHVADDISDPQKYGKCDRFVPLTIGRLAAGAVDRNDKDLKPADIVIRGFLARKIRAAVDPITGKGTVDLDPRDVDLIHDQIAKTGLPPSVIIQAFDLLAPPAKN